jgi:branched-subunit amino acid transport protein
MSSLLEGFVGIVGLAVITVVTRAFFLLPEREVPLPGWLRQGLRHAPLAALAAVAVPEVIMTHGRLVDTLADARLYGAAVSVAYFFWRRDILGTILTGTAVTMALRLGLGW